MSKALCSKCDAEPRVPGQRWGRACRAQEKRDARKRAAVTRAGNIQAARGTLGATGGVEETPALGFFDKKVPPSVETPGNAPAEAKAKANTRANELVPFTPFLDGLPDRLEPWYPPFIIALAKYGRITLAAGAVQVHRRVAYGHIAKNRALSAEVDAAKAHYRSGLEYGLAHQFHTTGNVLAGFGALRAELPGRYIEKQAIMNVNVSAPPEGVDAAGILRAMLQDVSPTTRALLAGPGSTVIDVPPALPEADPPR